MCNTCRYGEGTCNHLCAVINRAMKGSVAATGGQTGFLGSTQYLGNGSQFTHTQKTVRPLPAQVSSTVKLFITQYPHMYTTSES